MHREYPIVVLSHLRWDAAYRRPQHLLSRLAARHRVCFIETPEHEPGLATPRWDRSDPERNVRVYRPRTSGTAPGFHPAQMDDLRRLMPELLGDLDGQRPVAWLYTPLALPLADRLAPAAVVYDCIEEVSLLHVAPPEVVPREEELLRRADLVFTSGPSLYRAKRNRRPDVHCLPNSVDEDHFARARPRRPRAVRPAEPADQDPLPHPRLGFFGPLDERLDLGLLAAVADAHPDWHLVLVGPVAEIPALALPRRPNVHYFGQRTYGELPAYLAGWDICLLPFALNEATRFISPTQTLEYMAAERPIVGTPITDVAEPFGDIVRIAGSRAEFVAACEAALVERESERTRRIGRMRELLARTSWDATAAATERLVTEMVAHRGAPESAETTALAPAGRAL